MRVFWSVASECFDHSLRGSAICKRWLWEPSNILTKKNPQGKSSHFRPETFVNIPLSVAMGWMFVSSPNSYIESNSQCDSIGKWGLWEVVGSLKVEPWKWDQHPCKKRRENLLPLFPASDDTTGNQEFASWKNILIRIWPHWHPDLRLPISRTVRKEMSVIEASQLMAFCYSSPSSLK